MAKQGFIIKFRPTEICVMDSIYTLLLYLLVNKCKVDRTLFIFFIHIPDNIACNFNYVRSWKGGYLMRSKRYIFLNFYYSLKFHLFMTINRLYGVKMGGMDHLPVSRRLINLRKCKFYEYEDGTSNYSETEGMRLSVKNTKINRLLQMDTELYFGRSPKVVKAYLTHPELHVPDLVKNKVEWIDIKDKWMSLDEDQRKWILKIYNLPSYDSIIGCDTVLMTRPFSEAGLGEEEEKIRIFESTLKGIDLKKVIIKPHYIEKTDYSKLFPLCRVLKGNFPIELLCLAYGSCIKQIITIGNCSAETFFSRYFPDIKYTKIYNDKYNKF